MLGIPVETFENPDALNPLNWFDSSDFEDKFTSWLKNFKNEITTKIENITKDWPENPESIFGDIKATLGTTVKEDIPNVINHILTGGFDTDGFDLGAFATGIKDGFDGGANWFRGIVDWFVNAFKQLFAWIFNPISAAFSSVYGFFIALCYIYITIQCVGILVELFSIAKIIAG